jgi:probable phosphoglycerate mutase
MKIYLFRHGETDWNKARRLQGQSDIPLNAFGRELAVKTAEALQHVSFDAAFSSPLCRATETARILLGTRSIPLITDCRLMEINFGDCEGWGFDEAKKDPAHPLYCFFRQPQAYIPPAGAETFQDAHNRSKAFFTEKILPLEEQCKNVLIVAHGAFNRCVLNALAEISLEDFWNIELPNCAASILSLENGNISILEKSKVYYGSPVNGSP